jgi:hypothetical protein
VVRPCIYLESYKLCVEDDSLLTEHDRKITKVEADTLGGGRSVFLLHTDIYIMQTGHTTAYLVARLKETEGSEKATRGGLMGANQKFSTRST